MTRWPGKAALGIRQTGRRLAARLSVCSGLKELGVMEKGNDRVGVRARGLWRDSR